MVCRSFKVDSNGYWYRIAAIGSATNITRECEYEGSGSSGESYTIGQSTSTRTEGAVRTLAAYWSNAGICLGLSLPLRAVNGILAMTDEI